MFRAIGIGLVSAAMLTACDATTSDAQPAPGSVQTGASAEPIAGGLEGQSYSVSDELFGYFLPYEDVSIGTIRLDHISLAMNWEFQAFMDGETDAFPPISLHFDDTSSPTGVGELGNTYYEVTHRIQPEIFRVTDDELLVFGRHDLLGEVRFEGYWQADQVRQMMSGDPSTSAALTGDLKIGDVVFEDVTFQGWLGD